MTGNRGHSDRDCRRFFDKVTRPLRSGESVPKGANAITSPDSARVFLTAITEFEDPVELVETLTVDSKHR